MLVFCFKMLICISGRCWICYFKILIYIFKILNLVFQNIVSNLDIMGFKVILLNHLPQVIKAPNGRALHLSSQKSPYKSPPPISIHCICEWVPIHRWESFAAMRQCCSHIPQFPCNKDTQIKNALFHKPIIQIKFWLGHYVFWGKIFKIIPCLTIFRWDFF